MTRRHTLELEGYSDDCHNAKLDGKSLPERYHPYEVHIEVGGLLLTATMVYRHPGWVCLITVPRDDDLVTITIQENTEEDE